MSKHTPEPWDVIDRLTIQGPRVAGDPLKCGLLVASLPHWCEPEDSRRIVACVNACAGLPTEQLEVSPLGGVLNGVAGLIAQRDELLAALEIIVASEEFHGDSFVCDFGTLQGVARAAIAKAKGGEA